MGFFVNLPVRYAVEKPGYLGFFLARGLCPELGLDARSLEYDERTHAALAGLFRGAGLEVAVHLPFLLPEQSGEGSGPEQEMSRLLDAAAAILPLYRPRHMVAHAGFLRRGRMIRLEPEVFRAPARAGGGRLFLENVWEEEPEDVLDFARAIGEETGVCLDLGHWHAFAGGAGKRNLARWLERLKGRLRHFHLHDNRGDRDAHLGPGAGSIDWQEFFGLLAREDIQAGCTVEPHTPQDLERVFSFFAARPDWGALLGMPGRTGEEKKMAGAQENI